MGNGSRPPILPFSIPPGHSQLYCIIRILLPSIVGIMVLNWDEPLEWPLDPRIGFKPNFKKDGLTPVFFIFVSRTGGE